MSLLAKQTAFVNDLLKENAGLKKQIAILQDKYFEKLAQEYARAFFKKFFTEHMLPDLLKKPCEKCGYACVGTQKDKTLWMK